MAAALHDAKPVEAMSSIHHCASNSWNPPLETFFDRGSPRLNRDGRELLVRLAQELAKLPNMISIEGHTGSKPYATSGNYSNWELSTDRAQPRRRLMQANRPDQVTQVRGFVDQR
ncbi:MAG TPA: OmpA family protein [Candidatus Polarisedimenticolia bacterium]|nr:OmpA family protein [Candidatus Polarisedimenticolia bacterium]